jgi:hypothetical protein
MAHYAALLQDLANPKIIKITNPLTKYNYYCFRNELRHNHLPRDIGEKSRHNLEIPLPKPKFPARPHSPMARCPTAVELRQTIQTKPLSLWTANYRVSFNQQAPVILPKERRERRGGHVVRKYGFRFLDWGTNGGGKVFFCKWKEAGCRRFDSVFGLGWRQHGSSFISGFTNSAIMPSSYWRIRLVILSLILRDLWFLVVGTGSNGFLFLTVTQMRISQTRSFPSFLLQNIQASTTVHFKCGFFFLEYSTVWNLVSGIKGGT